MDIVLEHICKSYAGKQILRDFSCRIPDGSICAVTAPSGTGKTTLLRLILGLEAPDSGSISGVPERKSAVFQEDRLCPELSVLRNIRMAVPGIREQEALACLDALGIADSASLPVCRLSGGMARRASLARALLYDGHLLALDEPFSGLDDKSRLAACEVILRYRAGRTLLVVTHHEEDLELLNAGQRIRL